MNRSVFSYCLALDEISEECLPNKHIFGKYGLYTDANTPYNEAASGENLCVLFGYAVNVITGNNDVVSELVKCENINALVKYEKELGGKYVIFYKNREDYYILCDATSSVPVFYSTECDIATNLVRLIVSKYGYVPDKEYQKIRAHGELSQAMPYEITVYKEVKQLICNHYYNVNKKQSVRFTNAVVKQKVITIEEATKKALPMIDNLTNYYSKLFNIYCPITAGRDSRVVLAFLIANTGDAKCYTIAHKGHGESSQDVNIPIEMCEKLSVSHSVLNDAKLSDEYISIADSMFIKDSYSNRTLQIAQTINEVYSDGAIINGDIIGQVGKCSLHRDIPRIFATPRYFRCKLHNYSKESLKQLKLWLYEIKESGEKINTFDLFSIENRMGRWAAQENLIYNAVGQLYLNIFNSRSIIYIWTAVKRKERKKSLLHINLIKEKYPSLLDVPFEKDESALIRLSKSTGLLYLSSSYLKYYIEKRSFMKEKRNEKVDNNGR